MILLHHIYLPFNFANVMQEMIIKMEWKVLSDAESSPEYLLFCSMQYTLIKMSPKLFIKSKTESVFYDGRHNLAKK